MKFTEEQGDLFELPKSYCLAHCISNDHKWGAGIAVEFNKRFPGMKSYCIKQTKKLGLKHPVVIPYMPIDKSQVIFNLVTKDVYYHKPTYDTLHECLKQMYDYCKVLKVKDLGLPILGCGLDKLKWDKVREDIINTFHDLDINIVVRHKK